MKSLPLSAVILRVAFWTILAIAAFSVYVWWTRPPALGGDFSLVSSDGRKVTQADLRAKPAAVFFGYTNCPDICPTTLVDLQGWLGELGSDAGKINVWFVTVDPERDTPQVLHDYLSPINDSLASLKTEIVGISGEAEAVRKMVESFNIAARKVRGENSEYTFDHTAAVILLNKGGRLRGLIPYQEKDNIAAEQLKALADSGG